MPFEVNTLDKRMLTELVAQSRSSKRLCFAVAFLMESGVKLILEPLKAAIARGAEIELITGTYMQVTEPSALYLLRSGLGHNITLRLFNDQARVFHPKAYFFYGVDDATVFVGSSNISRSALTTGVEWNYGIRRSMDPASFTAFEQAYGDLRRSSKLLDDDVLREYAKQWQRPRQIYAFTDPPELATETDALAVQPRGAQIEALYELERSREDGYDKALVVAATGLGKTYLAAFDSRGFDRVLFVAHREEILRQAAQSFHLVRPGDSIGFFSGPEKVTKADMIFATVQTLGQEEYLQGGYFGRTQFDYVVIDEFHHAAADSYQTLLNYFQPKFLLGLTATPDRMDNKDIYALCDHNIAYEVSLRNAVERDWLVPFRYYAVYDETDYDKLDYRNGHYDIDQLERSLSREERARLVLEHYQRRKRSRALGFCASIGHAESMTNYFRQHGVKAAFVVSANSDSPFAMDREAALRALVEGELDIIFSVDIFNEGVDIPAVDMVLFLRPTESYTVFMQQLGRGLRKHPGKKDLLVLDFIGNYKKAHLKPAFLSGEVSFEKGVGTVDPEELDLPDGCFADWDFRLIDLFKQQQRREPLKLQLIAEYRILANKLGRRPTRHEINGSAAYPFRTYYQKYDSWLKFLDELGELGTEEQSWLNTPAEAFLRELERTSMSKAYKVPTILSFLQDDDIRPTATLTEIAHSFKEYYSDRKYQVDLQDKRHAGWQSWGVDEFKKLARDNPVKFLSQSGPFNYNLATETFSIDPAVWPFLSPALAKHVRDIMRYKTDDYFRRHY